MSTINYGCGLISLAFCLSEKFNRFQVEQKLSSVNRSLSGDGRNSITGQMDRDQIRASILDESAIVLCFLLCWHRLLLPFEFFFLNVIQIGRFSPR